MMNDPQSPARLAVTTPAGTTYFRIGEVEPLEGGGTKMVLITTDC